MYKALTLAIVAASLFVVNPGNAHAQPRPNGYRQTFTRPVPAPRPVVRVNANFGYVPGAYLPAQYNYSPYSGLYSTVPSYPYSNYNYPSYYNTYPNYYNTYPSYYNSYTPAYSPYFNYGYPYFPGQGLFYGLPY